VKIYVAAVQALTKKETEDETQFSTKIGGKTILGPSYFPFVKFSFPVKCLMPYYAETGCSYPPDRLTLRITLLYVYFQKNYYASFHDFNILKKLKYTYVIVIKSLNLSPITMHDNQRQET
jgi:hypothetical protein